MSKTPGKDKELALNYLNNGINNKSIRKGMLDEFKQLATHTTSTKVGQAPRISK